jgi:hypothetical protein
MATQDKGWLAEIERRAAVYDALGDGGDGRLTGADYFGMLALAVVLTLVFWSWAV